jgi:hypothetical protein
MSVEGSFADLGLRLYPNDDYNGDHWVGTSPESDTPGVIRHSWITEQCRKRGLRVQEIPGEAFDSQYRLRISYT